MLRRRHGKYRVPPVDRSTAAFDVGADVYGISERQEFRHRSRATRIVIDMMRGCEAGGGAMSPAAMTDLPQEGV
jgi:hypothetical protein